MRKLIPVLLMCCFLIGFGNPAMAKMTLKFGLVAPQSHPETKAAEAFAKYVKTKTKGEISIDVFPMGQLGAERSMVEQVQGGTLDMMDCTTAVLSNFVPEVALFDLPFLWPSRGVAYSVTGDSEFFKIFADTFPKKGFVAIGYGENEMRDLTTLKKEVRRPEDVKGLKIRVMEAPVYLETWRTLGASPVPMPFPEIYNALQQGVIDAQENPLLTSVLMKFTEVCPYATVTNYCLTECIKVVNVDVWARLTPEQQQIFRDGADLAIKMNRELGMKMLTEVTAELEKKGKVKITRLTEEERNAFFEKVQPVYEKFEKKTGTIPNKPEYGRFAGMSYLKMMQEKIKQYQ
ncbi:MAG: TRAP transporter substrate-binding protein DctP [Desulfobacteraceae bacterium]|jgi:tripartite ATP-independent transporter DctP family solute receptor